MRNLTSCGAFVLAASFWGLSVSCCGDDKGKKSVSPDAAVDAMADTAPDLAVDKGINDKFTTMVTPSRTLNTLTPQESEKVCQATTEFIGKGLQDPAVADLGCRITALVAVLPVADNEVKSTCQQAYAACKAVPPPDALPTDQCGNPIDTTCMATVAEYEACVSELPSDLMLLSRLIPTCDNATKTSLVVLAAGANLLGPACQAFDKKCPGTLSGLSNLPSGLGSLPGGFMQPRR